MAGDVLSINPWKTDESRFPRSGSIRDQLAFCVNYAVLAPSIHNTQPWLFRLLDDSIELYIDRGRSLPVTDPDGRELMISCGAALANLLVAIHRFGYEGWVQYAPDHSAPDLLARVRVGRAREPDYSDESMFRSIRRRRSVRKPFQARPVPRELQRRMIWLASEFGCWLYFAESGAERHQIASLVEEAHVRQLGDAEYQAERACWMGTGDRAQTNGVTRSFEGDLEQNGSRSPMGSGEPTVPIERWMERDRELIKSSPALFVLGSSVDAPLEWLRTGEALQRILLRAEMENVSASFLNQPCHFPDLRDQLRVITGRNGPPHVLLRMGYGTGIEPSPRRPVRDVILPPLDS